MKATGTILPDLDILVNTLFQTRYCYYYSVHENIINFLVGESKIQ